MLKLTFNAHQEVAKALGETSFGEADLSLLTGQASTPPFPVDAMGPASDWLQQSAKAANAPVDYVAAAMLGSFSAVLANVRWVMLGEQWVEPPIVWSLQVGPPSSGKTPSTKPFISCLKEVETDWALKHKDALEAEIAQKTAEADSLEGHARKKLEAQIQALEERKNLPPRLLAMDSTIEAIAHLQIRSPRGLIVNRDELSGLLAKMKQASGAPDKAYYDEAWNGGPYCIDRRKEGGSISIRHHSLALLGGIQPDRLQSLLMGSEDDDGFLARCLLFCPEPTAAYILADAPPIASLKLAITRLAALQTGPDGEPVPVRLEPSAFARFNEWAAQDKKIAIGHSGMLGSAFGKFRGYCARLALIHSFMTWAWEASPPTAPPGEISLASVEAAIKLIEEYLRPQAKRVFAAADWTPAERLARALLRELQKRKCIQFNAREAFREWHIQGSSKGNAGALRKEALELLQEANWIKQVFKGGPGRPAAVYDVNPAIASTN